ncbi:MAG TPA: ABC transporter ATP-binding protein [Kiritimatiellia bacterium]|nr:ABC transporter ATP-binding protein [Kiritimatiellia bacterium]
MHNVLSFSNVTKCFSSGDGEITAIQDIDFELGAGMTCALLGPSGSGKTTLLSLAAGLDDPTSGSVAFEGTDWRRLNEDQRAAVRLERVGFVFQSFQLIGTLNAVENVAVSMELLGRRDALIKSGEILARVGLGHRLHHYPSQLSGGEQQRVAIARAFANNPTVLFADEPTGNLDHATAGVIIDLLFDLNREYKTTLFLVTHDRDLASRCAMTLRLKGGKIDGDIKSARAGGLP